MFASTTFSNSRQNDYERYFAEMQDEQRMRDAQFAKQTMQLEGLKEQERQTAKYEHVLV